MARVAWDDTERHAKLGLTTRPRSVTLTPFEGRPVDTAASTLHEMGKGGYRKGRKRPNDSGPGGYASRQKHANGEGDYPPEHVLENPAFETYYRESGIVPEAEWDAMWKPRPMRPASAAQAAEAGRGWPKLGAAWITVWR